MINVTENLPDLTDADKQFVTIISSEFELPIEEIELLLRYVMAAIDGMCEVYYRFTKSKINFREINYKSEYSKRESDALFASSKYALDVIDENLQAIDYRKFIIAGLILKYLKLDKYSRLRDKEDLVRDGYNDNDYKHYLYSRMKSRFKTVRKIS